MLNPTQKNVRSAGRPLACEPQDRVPTAATSVHVEALLNGTTETRIMLLDQWLGTIENPRQRDTVKRAQIATRKHLRVPHPTHRFVAAARLPNGKLIKLDGHTRSYLWATGKLEAPVQVTVTIYSVANRQEAMDLYDTFDNPAAVMTSADRLVGGIREHKVKLVSGCLSGSSSLHISSFRMADGLAFYGAYQAPKKETEGQLVQRWKPYLELIDSQNYTRLDTGLLAGLLLSWLLHAGTSRQAALLDFWAHWFEGRKSGETRHWFPAEALHFRVEMEKHIGGAGRMFNEREVAYLMLALDAHIDGKTYIGKKEPNGLNLNNVGRLADVTISHAERYGGFPPESSWLDRCSAARAMMR